jgi:peptidoglycan/xylan/chitin deacetylase (PgdA/CDA1 family)
MYHSVGEPNRYGNVSVRRLERDLRYLQKHCEIVDLPEIMKDQDASEKRVAVTFDDGWDDFYKNAVPVLEEENVPATVFVVSMYIGSDVMMSKDQVSDIIENHENVTVGNHTKSHPKLSRIGDEEELERQILGAKEDLEEEFGISVNRFCYPSGDFDDEAVDVVKGSHSMAVSTIPRVAGEDLEFGVESRHRYVLPRIAAHNSKARVRWEMSDTGSRMRSWAKSSGLASR